MKAQLANEFYTWLFLLSVMMANAGLTGFLLFSKSPNPQSLRLRCQRDAFFQGRGRIGFVCSILLAVVFFFFAIKAHSVWAAYEVPYWRR